MLIWIFRLANHSWDSLPQMIRSRLYSFQCLAKQGFEGSFGFFGFYPAIEPGGNQQQIQPVKVSDYLMQSYILAQLAPFLELFQQGTDQSGEVVFVFEMFFQMDVPGKCNLLHEEPRNLWTLCYQREFANVDSDHLLQYGNSLVGISGQLPVHTFQLILTKCLD